MRKELSRNKELLLNTVIFAIGTIGTKLIQFLLVPLYSTYMTAAQFGEADLIISSMSMVYPLLCLGIDQSVIRFGLTKQEGKGCVLKSAISVSALGGIVLCILVVVLSGIELIHSYSYFIILIYFGISFYAVLTNYCKALEKNIFFSINSILHALILFVFNYLLIARMETGVFGYIVSVLGAYLLSITILTIGCKAFSSFIKSKWDGSLTREMIRYSLPLVPNVMSWWIIQMSDRYMITFFLSISTNGYYSMAYKVPSVFNLIVGIFLQAFDITIFKEVDRGVDKDYVERMYRYYISVSFVSGSIIMLLIKPIAYFFLKNDFYDAWYYVPFLLFAYIISNLQSFYGVLYSGFKHTSIVFKTTMCGAIVNIMLNLMLIPIIGAIGAAVATVVSYVTVYITRVIGMKKVFVFNNEIKRIIISLTLIFVEALLYMTKTTYGVVFGCFVPLVLVLLFRAECRDIIHVISRKIRRD